ncbi:MAG: chemotaxis protein CheR [Desulfuromonas sp.]|nr:MAG: chemotaxis protein CheR [Desulfuromonas sp.]
MPANPDKKSAGRDEKPFFGSEFPEDQYQSICKLLLERRDFDLGWYKDRCIKRRIAIRVRACGMKDAAAYAELLTRDDGELDELLTTLTIHVSQFMRNPTTYKVIETQLPLLDTRIRKQGRGMQIWSVGCSSGEEPYSLAIILDQQGLEADRLLATDISAAVLKKAAEGRYDPQRLVNIPEEWHHKYFTREGRWYIVKDRLRRRVSFAKHDMLSDPYPQADLIVCRNVLIYFSRQQQERILGQFAEALSDQGVLVLGKAETMLGPVREAFRAIDHAERIYARRRV